MLRLKTSGTSRRTFLGGVGAGALAVSATIFGGGRAQAAQPDSWGVCGCCNMPICPANLDWDDCATGVGVYLWSCSDCSGGVCVVCHCCEDIMGDALDCRME